MYLPECDSTSSLIRREYLSESDGFFIRTDFQTGGRGQQGNRWESEAGQNLLFSILLRPNIPAEQAWHINTAVALAIIDALREVDPADCLRDSLRIKWPNDIYIGDGKLCGTLIENFLSSASVASSIVGIGLNVRQTVFRSDAPNPTSLAHHLPDGAQSVSLDELARSVLRHIHARMDEEDATLREHYHALLYRADGRYYPFEACDRRIMARVLGVSAQGELLLETEDGVRSSYRLKEIKHVIARSGTL